MEDQTKHVINKSYIGADHQYEDAYVASSLCDGGAIKYELRPDATTMVTDDWLFTIVIPSIRQRWMRDHRFCKVMALAKLWAVFDNEASSHLMTLADRDRIQNSFTTAFSNINVTTNPVVKIRLEVLNINGYLHIVNAHRGNINEAVNNDNYDNNEPVENNIMAANNNGAHNAMGQQVLAYNQEQFNSLHQCLDALNQRFDALEANRQADRDWSKTALQQHFLISM